MKRYVRINRLDAIWLEFKVASTATRLLEDQLGKEPSYGDPDGWRFRDAIRWRTNLESTFLIRMYAEFEASLRDVWKKRYRQTSQPPMKDLLVAIAARSRIPEDCLDDVNGIREHRNSLIHTSKPSLHPIPLDQARSRLKVYLSRLPIDW